ncbi:MAG TPA: tetratricopeptide repeat protein [Terriglobia bacterium]|nr:tetratricopeptide repeat protein [Terriglobia bacterium]
MSGRIAIAVMACTLLAPTAFAADPQVVYQHGVDSLYNLDFSLAEADFKNLTTEHPDDPLYWNGYASTIWLRILYSQQKLNIESFSMKDTFGTGQSKDDVNAAEEKRLVETVNTAIAKADALLKKNPNDVRALYSKGMSFGSLATFHATAQRKYFLAKGEAEKARDLHRQVLRIDPNFHDAEMSIGAYNYVVAIIPGWVKFTLFFVGFNGEGKDVGIRQIEDTARLGKLGATDAKMLLLIVYNREGRHADSMKIVDELHARYPRNFIFEMSRAQVFRKLGKYDRAYLTYQEILKKVAARTDGYERLRSAKVYYDIAKSQTEEKDFGAVFASYTKVVEPTSDATPNERADAQIWMGMILDSQNDRKNALAHYNEVAKLDCNPEYKDRAARYIRRAYGP